MPSDRGQRIGCDPGAVLQVIIRHFPCSVLGRRLKAGKVSSKERVIDLIHQVRQVGCRKVERLFRRHSRHGTDQTGGIVREILDHLQILDQRVQRDRVPLRKRVQVL